jgi:predicted phosphodiesterase
VLEGWPTGGHAIFAGGHTHFAMVCRFGAAFVINPGSVGMAYDRTGPADVFLKWQFAPICWS